jgi:hypothetical protein
MRLDLGGIAKGYAADEAVKVLAKHGVERALVACGGDIRVSGPPPGTEGWRVAIAPLKPGAKPSEELILKDSAVSTSGDAEQFVEIDGKRYSHIVDPRTGIGLVGRMSVTVTAPDGTASDSLTKVVCVLGPEKGFKLLATRAGVSCRMVRLSDDGEAEAFTMKNFPELHLSRSERAPIALRGERRGVRPPVGTRSRVDGNKRTVRPRRRLVRLFCASHGPSKDTFLAWRERITEPFSRFGAANSSAKTTAAARSQQRLAREEYKKAP